MTFTYSITKNRYKNNIENERHEKDNVKVR